MNSIPQETNQNKRHTLRWVVAIVTGISIVIGYLIYLGAVTDFFNQAKIAANPIISQLQHIGAAKVCEGGDPGFGPDNLQPWYGATYVISNSPTLTQQVMNIASAQGYSLKSNMGQSNSDPGNNPQSDQLTGENGQKDLSITISPVSSYLGSQEAQTDAATCSKAYNSLIKQTNNGGQSIIQLFMEMPDPKLNQ